MNIGKLIDLPSPSPIEQISRAIMVRVAASRDAAIKQALDDALGVNGWSMDTVASRASWSYWPGRCLVLLDGRPLIEFKAREPDLLALERDVERQQPTIDYTEDITRFNWKPQ
jgi:hypothetical protein